MRVFDVLTLFPEMFQGFLNESLIARAQERGLLDVNLVNYRQHGLGKHSKVDDEPYGGGPGMVLRVEPIVATLREREAYHQSHGRTVRKVMLTPQGTPFQQATAQRWSTSNEVLLLLCGRYEGFDERIRHYVDEEVSGGDFVCLGGEVVAMTVIEAVSRLLPGVMGNQKSSGEESFSEGWLEYPQYTRPLEFEGHQVPEVLLSGHHQRVADWRQQEARERTRLRRPDLWKNHQTGEEAS